MTVCLSGMGLATPLGTGRTPGQTPPLGGPESYTLSQCAIVQLGDSPRVYLARADGELEAVDVQTGVVLWHTKRATLPLLARHHRLLALLPMWLGKPGWDLAVLDSRSGRILATFAAWAKDAAALTGGRVGPGDVSSRVEGIFRAGQDYVVWHLSQRVYSPIPPPPGHPNPGRVWTAAGAAKVDLVTPTVVPVDHDVSSPTLAIQWDAQGLYHVEPFEVDGVTVVAAKERVGHRVRIVLHRVRDSTKLPDVVVCDLSGQDGINVAVSEDRRHVLGMCLHRDPAGHPSGDLRVYSTVTGEQVGSVLNRAGPQAGVVWNDRLIYIYAERVGVVNLATGQDLFAVPVLSYLSLRNPFVGPQPPVAPPPRPHP